MRSLPLIAVLFLSGCSAEQSAPVPERPHRVVVADHTLEAFGGRLSGTDAGEWIGKLVFQDADGDLETVLNENVHGIVENPEGVFVFTGLAHLSSNEGHIYLITRPIADGPVAATRLGRLPGAPRRVHQAQRDGATSFLVHAGHSNGHQLFECYQLAGKIVSRGHDCLPPRRPPGRAFNPKPFAARA
ncbi:hypothetical protein K4L06_14640 [Lysobacter sp. BMK333-48F3]|uniref:hypothetical protein n=1 Tax=Lysobacter sp. BMK333-48F3 TaxID=2867962 RepID=UPI001C8CEFFD|nr:hypothetical protein [Lysobacter sp. BMK333-48F3]MBX9402545.1 hypothetical protein [Lysobacter sp. BMK333-48F3]